MAKVPYPPTSEPASKEPKRGPPNAETPKQGPEKPMNMNKTSREQKPDKEGSNEGAIQNMSETAKVSDTLTPEPASMEPKRDPVNAESPKKGPEKPMTKDTWIAYPGKVHRYEAGSKEND